MIDALDGDDPQRGDRRPDHERRREPGSMATTDHQFVGGVRRDGVGVLPRQIAARDPHTVLCSQPSAVGIAQNGRSEHRSEYLAACGRISKLKDRCEEISTVDDDVGFIDLNGYEDGGRILAIPIVTAGVVQGVPLPGAGTDAPDRRARPLARSGPS
jgi:hypothetical protein